ncbi:MAG: hypothetical protein ABSF80_02230 [Chitinispirillaceae bacterium]|jgi:hypothetical protein
MERISAIHLSAQGDQQILQDSVKYLPGKAGTQNDGFYPEMAQDRQMAYY